MNTGEKVINWLYTEQLKVDAEWSIREQAAFTWWADKNSQQIAVIGEEENEAGEKAYLVSVRTEFLYHLSLNRKTLVGINALLMAHASMSGPVYEKDTGTLWLCSLVKVHEGIREWMCPLISMAAVLQIAEARIMGPGVAKLFSAQPAESKHPTTGWRTEPDELAEIVATVVAPVGKQPSKWTARGFQQAVDQYMQRPPALCATAGDSGLTVEFTPPRPISDWNTACAAPSCGRAPTRLISMA